MPRTTLSGNQVANGSIQRDDIDVFSVGQSVITKVIQGNNVTISSTGVDSGTGDVTVNAVMRMESVIPFIVLALAISFDLSNYSSYGMPYLHTAANWPSGRNFCLEVFMKANTGTVYARLFNETANVAVAGSELSTNSPSFSRLRSESLSLTDGKVYRVQFGKELGNTGELLGAKLITYS